MIVKLSENNPRTQIFSNFMPFREIIELKSSRQTNVTILGLFPPHALGLGSRLAAFCFFMAGESQNVKPLIDASRKNHL